MFKKIVPIVLIALFFVPVVSAADLTLEDLMGKTHANQAKIKDMYAETETVMISSMSIPGQTKKGPQKMVQKGKMWTKGSDKSKIEMLSPTKQITITNGDKMLMINPETGQKMVQDLSKIKGQGSRGQGPGEMSLEKAMEYFDLSLKKDNDSYVITGIPKERNKFMSKMEFYLDSKRWVPTKILMYGGNGKLLSRSEIEYEKISGVFVPVRNSSNVNTPMGKMEIEMVYSNIKVNQGIKDEVFRVE
ncbi:MAG: outer membrane lipoprotein-sorting protein [Candidatus Margulisbacteria bacterium]|nr:outer membrane lipoprotein-sorting protein [Candidatus Margulisiibacteriota bacterium]